MCEFLFSWKSIDDRFAKCLKTSVAAECRCKLLILMFSVLRLMFCDHINSELISPVLSQQLTGELNDQLIQMQNGEEIAPTVTEDAK